MEESGKIQGSRDGDRAHRYRDDIRDACTLVGRGFVMPMRAMIFTVRFGGLVGRWYCDV